MTTPKTFIVNVETGEEIVREYNDDELAQQEIDVATQKAKMEAEAQAKANKEAAQLKLETLGLTADDLKALGL
jgi:predicted metal-binding protein